MTKPQLKRYSRLEQTGHQNPSSAVEILRDQAEECQGMSCFLFWKHQSFSNSNLRHLWHALDSNHLPVPEMLQSTSHLEPLPAIPNTTACSFHSNPLSDTPSEGCSETSLDSTPSDPNSTLTFLGDSLSGDTPSHTSAVPNSTPPLGRNSAPLCFSSQNSALPSLLELPQMWNSLRMYTQSWLEVHVV